ncbi:hypothetical protein H7H37_08270, partial [Mycolicibacterium insubricum]|nr:hypothetical protein [Mycolicibacterium insubricum]
TYAVVPALRYNPELAEIYEPLLTSRVYDPVLRVPATKSGITAWAKAGDLCDVILIGGGVAGGEGSNSATGPGGNAASYVTQTITLGVQLAPNGTLSGTVGAGGTPNGSAGGATTCTQLGLSAAGATGTSAGQAGKTPTPVTVGGTTYADFGAGGDGGPSKGIFGLGNGTGAPGQRGGVLICVRGAS